MRSASLRRTMCKVGLRLCNRVSMTVQSGPSYERLTMDKETWAAVGVLSFAGVAVVFLLALRRNGGKQDMRIGLKAPGVSLDASSSSSADAGVVVEDAKSNVGGLIARDESGRGIRAARIEVQKDILLTNSAPPADEPPKY